MKTFKPYVFVHGGALIWTMLANMFPFSVQLDSTVKTENSRKTITGVFVEANLPIILFPQGCVAQIFSSLLHHGPHAKVKSPYIKKVLESSKMRGQTPSLISESLPIGSQD